MNILKVCQLARNERKQITQRGALIGSNYLKVPKSTQTSNQNMWFSFPLALASSFDFDLSNLNHPTFLLFISFPIKRRKKKTEKSTLRNYPLCNNIYIYIYIYGRSEFKAFVLLLPLPFFTELSQKLENSNECCNCNSNESFN